MNLQRVSNTRLQNFGQVVVLEPGDKLTWRDIDSMTAGASYGKNWVSSDKVRLVVYNGTEQAEIEKIRNAIPLLSGQHKKSALTRIWQRVQEFGQKVKPRIVNSMEDLKGITGFEQLCSPRLVREASDLKSCAGILRSFS